MFEWYRKADRCYVYLSDVSAAKRKSDSDVAEWDTEFKKSRWFTRGWTLQELIAPHNVEFFSRMRRRLGDRYSLRKQILEVTGIPEAVLSGEPLSQFSVNDRMSWIEHRSTQLEEDKAYALLGIFGVYMLPIYSEGLAKAFKRLQTELLFPETQSGWLLARTIQLSKSGTLRERNVSTLSQDTTA